MWNKACTGSAMVWLLAACLGFSCDGGPATPPQVARPKPDLRLFVLTDPKGYLEPCGCQQRPLGGLDKLSTRLASERAEGIPSLLVAAGDLTYGVELSAADAERARNQERWRAQTLVEVWSQLGLTAATPGVLDFAAGDDERRALAARSKFAWLADNVADQAGAPPEGLSRARIFEAGGIKVGVFGLLAANPALKLPAGATLDSDLAGASRRTSAALREQGARVVVALVDADRRNAREVAESGPDVVVMGGVDLEEPIPPALHGGAIVVHAGRQGQRLVTLDLELDAQGEFHDASTWTAQAQQKDLEARVLELSTRIRAWEKDPNVKASDLETQRARLAELEREQRASRPPSYTGRWFDARVADLAPEVPADKTISALLDAYDKRVNDANGKLHVAPLKAAEGAAVYAGSDSCKGCHEAAYAWWRGTKHGRAYQTLVERNKQFDLSCVGCHVVGYNEPGGSTVTPVEHLKDVGCESCHGPGSLHNAAPKEHGLVVRDTPESTCVSCHNHEHSPRFVYDAFRMLLIAPGHGSPETGGQKAKAN